MFPEAFETFIKGHISLLSAGLERSKEEWLIPIRLPAFPDGMAFSAWLVLPRQFQTTSRARIRLSKDAILRIPHVEADGNLCIDGEPGSGTTYNDEERINSLLCNFYENFVDPWILGKLDNEFEKEALSYWRILIGRRKGEHNPIERIFTVDSRHEESRVYTARLLQPSRFVIAGDNSALAERFIASLGHRSDGSQLLNVLVADVPIDSPLTPKNWPNNEAELLQLLDQKLSAGQRSAFDRKGRRNRSIYRIVILRAQGCSFGFLLSDGPPTIVKKGQSVRAIPCPKLFPLLVERVDPSWSYGRDQHPWIDVRQQKKVVVFGAGALGSPVIEQLAKAGVGSIIVVDPDLMSSANISRHLLGAESVQLNKAKQVVRHLSLTNPAVSLKSCPISAQKWLASESLSGVDVILDLTAESEVRRHIEEARQQHPCPLLIGWLEPFVAAAHACALRECDSWLQQGEDPMAALQAVSWPDGIMQREPSCTSDFQSYTASAAAYAVALVAETALALLDGDIPGSIVKSWVRGQKFLDRHHQGLSLRGWANEAVDHDGMLIERPWI